MYKKQLYGILLGIMAIAILSILVTMNTPYQANSIDAVDISPEEEGNSKAFIFNTSHGFSFEVPSGWEVTETSVEKIILKQMGGFGDEMEITYSTGDSVTTESAKSGKATFYFDESTNTWLFGGQDQKTGEEFRGATATPAFYIEGRPIFIGTTRWLTFVMPLSPTSFVTFNITGSGNTKPLHTLMSTVKFNQ